MKILTHPDNIAELRDALTRGDSVNGIPDTNTDLLFSYEIVSTPYLDKDEPTGRYIMPDGSIVEASEIKIRDRFVTYGPEDIDWLLFAGHIKEERTAIYRVVDPMRIAMFSRSYLRFMPFRSVVVTDPYV